LVVGLCGLAILTGVLGVSSAAWAGPTLTISSENTTSHVQTRVLEIFAQRLEARLGGALTPEVHAGAELFRDRDVVDALAAGRVGMAAPGIWHLGRFEPNFEIPLLPMFHGRDPKIAHEVADTVLSAALSQRLEEVVDVHVLGRWIDLGPAHLFLAGGGVVTRFEDLRGRSIRVAGGAANGDRIAAFGADPQLVPWVDLPAAMAAGTVSGTLTSAATVVSARLWEAGLTQAYLDYEYFPQYVPMVSGPLWRRLPKPVQKAMTETWDGLVEEARASAARDQASALGVLEGVGMVITRPDDKELARARTHLMAIQEAIVSSMGLDPDLVRAAAERLP
jgi:C4-dicarboxylate-binding protein DctP